MPSRKPVSAAGIASLPMTIRLRVESDSIPYGRAEEKGAGERLREKNDGRGRSEACGQRDSPLI